MFRVIILFISAEFRTQLLTKNIILRYSMYNEKIESVAMRPIETEHNIT